MYIINDKSARTVVNSFQHFGTTFRIRWDYEREFDNRLIKDLCQLFDIKLS